MWRAIANDLALDRPPGRPGDPVWLGLALLALAASAVVWSVVGVDPLPMRPRDATAWLGLLAWQPLIEELLFRGLVQGTLLQTRAGRAAWGPVSAANLTASGLFTAAHFLHHAPLWAAATLGPSLALGWLRERHRSTWSAVIAHALFNAAFFGGSMLVAG
ncbi:MAG: JDVT-CTERM system CAAX-type protease [Proteobacteria bacterium]|nr:JDVT-CTERM system CAAX-type protease [Pseudomonadota bacterium]